MSDASCGRPGDPIENAVEATFRDLVEAAPFGVVVVDASGKIALVNAYIVRLFGYTHEELLGRSTELWVPDRGRGTDAAQCVAWESAPNAPATGEGRDRTGQRKDGTEFPVEVRLSPVRWDGKTGALAAVVDISVRKRLEVELREANARLEEFTHLASHDLKTPLRGVSALAERLLEERDDAGSRKTRVHLERLRTRVARMERLIDDLLIYARGARASTEPIWIHPQELVLDHIEVSDDGPGIPGELRERVFNRFETVSSAERDGSDIGLALARRLVESNGGKIELASNDNARGSTFQVWWPRFTGEVPDE